MKGFLLFAIFCIGTIVANAIEPCGVIHNTIMLLAGALGSYSYILSRKKDL